MNIAIDIDDTLTELFDEKIKRCTNFFAEKNWDYHLVRTDTCKIVDMFNMTKEDASEMWFAIADQMMSEVAPRPHAAEVVKRLKEQGHHIYIVTARSTDWHNAPYELSSDWLNKNQIPFDELLINKEEKSQICIDKHVDLFIDDLPQNITSVQSVGIQTIAIQTRHRTDNELPPQTILCNDWIDIEQAILKLSKK